MFAVHDWALGISPVTSYSGAKRSLPLVDFDSIILPSGDCGMSLLLLGGIHAQWRSLCDAVDEVATTHPGIKSFLRV